MSVEFVSHLGTFLGATDQAMRMGLIAAAEVCVTDVKTALEHGYTSGDFVTGNNVNAVARGEPEPGPFGMTIAVGSRQVDPDYPVMWELGHHNLFTGKYERVEKWVPTMIANREKYVAVAAAEIKAVDGAL